MFGIGHLLFVPEHLLLLLIVIYKARLTHYNGAVCYGLIMEFVQ
jgi:hypothetical protein